MLKKFKETLLNRLLVIGNVIRLKTLLPYISQTTPAEFSSFVQAVFANFLEATVLIFFVYLFASQYPIALIDICSDLFITICYRLLQVFNSISTYRAVESSEV